MNLEKFRNTLENMYIIQTEETFRQFAGLQYNPLIIQEIAKIKAKCSRLFLTSIKEPRKLFLSCLENLAEDNTKTLENRLYLARNKRIIDKRFKINNNYVNWSNWRQFNAVEKKDENRKDVFDKFIAQTAFLKPVIKSRFDKIMTIYQQEGKINPLEGYLESEGIKYDSLRDFIYELLGRAEKPFMEKIVKLSKEILNKNPEYFDDFYYFRNIVFREISNAFIDIDPIQSVSKTLKILNFNVKNISFDTENRKNKYPSPICFFIDIPSDIRILYKRESPYFDFQGCYHESGHAMHATSISPKLEYEERYHIPMGITEIFSIFLERLTKNKKYLCNNIGITDERKLEKITELNNFMELFFVVFYSINSITKMKYWREKISIDETNRVYSQMFKKHMGIDMPGEYWMLHHILPESIMYVPSYLLAAIRAAELEKKIEERFGVEWWRREEAGSFLKEIMEKGGKINLSEFSKLDSKVFLDEIMH
ncbi:MAG: hypothetical protein M3162_04130 [Thermoproteota archaeon]|nr:hypothetical protein [Thermoproteota archaeon]